jgi:hypothetical protein
MADAAAWVVVAHENELLEEAFDQWIDFLHEGTQHPALRAWKNYEHLHSKIKGCMHLPEEEAE